MTGSDGVVFASPNYSFQVSAIMKIFLARPAHPVPTLTGLLMFRMARTGYRPCHHGHVVSR